MTAPTRATARRFPHEVYFLRRLLTIYLPMVVVGMALHLYSYTFTLTANGLTLITLFWVIAWMGIAARDSQERS